MAEKTHCDRCDTVVNELDPAFIDLSPEGFDLCRECVSALRVWVATSPTQVPSVPSVLRRRWKHLHDA